MKVLIANKFYFKNGGSEIVMFQERDFLNSEKVDVIDFSMADERNLPSEQASYFVSKRSYSAVGKLEKLKASLSLIHSVEAVKRFGSLLDDARPDIVHCHNIYHQLTPSIIGVAAERKIPVVMTLHDYKPICPVYTRLRNGEPCSACATGNFESVLKYRCVDGSFTKSFVLWLEARFQTWKRSYEQVAQFIAPSRFMFDSARLRFPDSQITYIANGIDASKIIPAESDSGYVIYFGRLSAEKGVKTLLRAHAASGQAWPLVIAGTGPLSQELITNFPDAKFLGHIQGADLQHAIAAASIVVVPSEWYENSPLSVLEAMAYGKPIIASRIGGIPELVVDGVTGVLFEPGDIKVLQREIIALIGDQEKRGRLGKAARTRVETNFSLKRHNKELLSLYVRLCSSP
ncbi:MAG TPA: glycosyltransferase family 4 protein [Methylocella sp.]|nr:glycosyltransferase family 4 protein [Methylocella sp.]